MACCQRGRAKTFCEDGNAAMLDGLRLTAGLAKTNQLDCLYQLAARVILG